MVVHRCHLPADNWFCGLYMLVQSVLPVLGNGENSGREVTNGKIVDFSPLPLCAVDFVKFLRFREPCNVSARVLSLIISIH